MERYGIGQFIEYESSGSRRALKIGGSCGNSWKAERLVSSMVTMV